MCEKDCLLHLDPLTGEYTDHVCSISEPPEEWRYVAGHEGRYAISNHGEVYSCPRTIVRDRPDRLPHQVIVPGRIMRQTPTTAGYPTVKLTSDDKATTRYVHELVASTFIGPRPVGMEICHKTGDPTENQSWNLRYDTSKNNHADKRQHGTEQKVGEGNSNCRHTESQILEVKQLLKTHTLTETARLTGINLQTVTDVRNQKTWKHVTVLTPENVVVPQGTDVNGQTQIA